jgi:acetyl-CoA synthetase
VAEAAESTNPDPTRPEPAEAPHPALPGLENLATEDRRFAPDVDFALHANARPEGYAWANADRLGFWAEQARALLTWSTPFHEVLDWSGAPVARWFADGTLNAAYNAVDRHVEAGHGDRVAIYFEGEPGDTRVLTYADLQREVSRAANALETLGVHTGDRVALYLPLIPEAVIAMLACARIGAPHSVVFGGFSAEALHSRILDAEAKLVITADGGFRRGAPSALKPAVDEAISKGAPTVEHVLVVRRTGQDVDWTDGRDVWWHDALEAESDEHTPVELEAEHPLFILYTSGTTGKPKGILHTTGGYLTQAAYTHLNVFDVKPETDVYWCTADVGWITGHTYVVYAPLINGATQVIYEGTPDTPNRGRWWQIVEKYKVSILYTAPTAIRTCMKWGDDIPAAHDLSSLRVLGSVGEPINPEAWVWYRRVIGGDRTPVVDTWWQTETGAIMISTRSPCQPAAAAISS